jgi:hypothetical protein
MILAKFSRESFGLFFAKMKKGCLNHTAVHAELKLVFTKLFETYKDLQAEKIPRVLVHVLRIIQ